MYDKHIRENAILDPDQYTQKKVFILTVVNEVFSSYCFITSKYYNLNYKYLYISFTKQVFILTKL